VLPVAAAPECGKCEVERLHARPPRSTHRDFRAMTSSLLKRVAGPRGARRSRRRCSDPRPAEQARRNSSRPPKRKREAASQTRTGEKPATATPAKPAEALKPAVAPSPRTTIPTRNASAEAAELKKQIERASEEARRTRRAQARPRFGHDADPRRLCEGAQLEVARSGEHGGRIVRSLRLRG